MRTFYLLFLLPILLLLHPATAQEHTRFESHWPTSTSRTWIGPEFWANRLQDWRVHLGRLECVQIDPDQPMRTVHLLTPSLAEGTRPFYLQVQTGFMERPSEPDGHSWTGFLIGAGHGRLDYRGASLVHHFSGEGGGLIAALDDTGRLVFRSNESETDRDVYSILDATTEPDALIPFDFWNDATLELDARPDPDGTFTLTLRAYNVHGDLASTALLSGVSEDRRL